MRQAKVFYKDVLAGVISENEEENFCNKFASEFLLPKNIVIHEFGGKRNHITLNELISTQKK